MSFSNLVKSYEGRGKITLKGGQCNGRVDANDLLISRHNNDPPKGKGAEYAAQYRTLPEFERKCPEVKEGGRIDVTSGEISQMDQLEELTSIGTIPNLQELTREDLTQVYRRYNFQAVEPVEQLEHIVNKKEEILALIQGNGVCVISGPTGCGKSTQIPQFILDSHASQSKHCNIVVTQPRRIAAISLAQRVCAERGWGEPGRIVGYQVGLDKRVGDDTRLTYCTTGVLLEKLIQSKRINNYTHIILDEVHEREEDMDLLMIIVKRLIATDSPNVKVILMSATMDVKKFANYFKVTFGKKTYPAPFYTIDIERKYSIQVFYLDSLNLVSNYNTFCFDEPAISEETYNAVPTMIRSFNKIDAEDYRCKRSNERKGAVLIFLPGLHQIETLHEILSKDDERQRAYDNPDFLNLWLCPLHSSITKDEQEKVVAYAPEGMRKVILSTNIAESSLTIPDVKYVIDFCLTKHLEADVNTGFTSLQMAWASHTNCIQREGRVGRVQHGRVYRMVPKAFYQFKMPATSTPEICRCPLELVVLKCKRLMEDECPLKIISHALDPPDLDSYEKTILKLKEIGGLLRTAQGVEDPLDGDLTFMGRVMGSLPLDIRISKLILLGHLFDVLEEAIIMGCSMSVRNIFMEPFQRRLEAYNNKLLWADLSESDAIAYKNAYEVWRQMTAMGKFKRSKSSELYWGKNYMLQIKNLREVARLEDEIKKRLKGFNITFDPNKTKPLWDKNETPLILKLVLAGAFYPNYYSCNSQNPNAEIEAVRILGGHNPFKCVYLQNCPHPAPIYFDQIKRIFRKNEISDNIGLHFDTSQKLIVEFNQASSRSTEEFEKRNLCLGIPGDIDMAVHRAIKLRQLNIPLTLLTLGPSEAKDRLNSLILSSRMPRLAMESHTSEYKPLIPWDQQMVELAVCHVEDAGHFYGHVYPSTKEKMREIHKLLNRDGLLSQVSGQVEVGAVYAAPYIDENDPPNLRPNYYRAKIMRKKKKSDKLGGENIVEVYFIDYGNSATLHVEELREIVNEEVQKELFSIPPQAIKCVLAEVGPNPLRNKGGCWGIDATKFVKEITQSKESWTTQIYSFLNGVASVKLFLEEDGENGQPPPTLNNRLIREGFAQVKEETYLSKKNHMKREEIARQEEPFNRVENKNVLKTSYQDLMSLQFSDGKRTHTMKGPSSPLEMKLYSKIRSSCQREVKVEWNSVNSVLLDSEPNHPYERLLVAGYVSQSADKSRLLLNHTTVLPNLDGLAALTCLLFAPTIELRTDENRSRYIGALCGLGFDSNSGEPYFPENDMEVKFDMEITTEDLLLIDKIRHNMNVRFCGEDSEDMAEVQLSKLRKRIKEFLNKLLATERHPIKVEHCINSHKWNLVNEKYLIKPYDEKNQRFFAESMLQNIYSLICAIELNPKGDYDYIQDLVKKLKNLSSCLKKDLPPKQLRCDLCDVEYQYWTNLREHLQTGHHQRLVKWLVRRGKAHGILPDRPPRAVAAPAPRP